MRIGGWAIAAVLAFHPTAPANAAPADTSAAETFRTICVAHGARMDATLDAALAAGFAPVPAPPLPSGITTAVAMARDSGDSKQVVLISTGKSAIRKEIATEVPVRGCAVTASAGSWDVRSFARSWIGLPPLIDVGGTALYSYFERPGGNVATPDDDLPGMIAGVNAGELRTLAVAERDGMRTASWGVFEVPAIPLTMPAAPAPVPAHATDPFAPCRWEMTGKGSKAKQTLHCPDKTGKFRSAFARGIRADTPTLAGGGDVTAMLQLAVFYLRGPEQVRDPATAFLWSKRAAEAGAPGGAFNTGLAYEDGVGVLRDRAEAARWYRVTVDRGHAPAMVNLAGLLLAQPAADRTARAAEAAALVRRAADAGAVEALFDMGHLHEKGIGVAQDMNEALRWYRLAADRKDSRAMLRLGTIHADGLGVAPDTAQAAKWFAGGVASTLKLARLLTSLESFVYGFDVPRRRVEAARAAENDPAMALRLGLYLMDEKTPGRDPATALRLLRIAADARIPAAAMQIGTMYAQGDGVPQSDAEAVRWLRPEAKRQGADAFRRVPDPTDKP